MESITRLPESEALCVLVVDDSYDAAFSMSMLLKLRGHRVHTADHGAQAITKAAEFMPDAILLDIAMPEMTGYDVIQQLRQKPETKDTLIIAISGYGDADARERSAQAGFDAHLVKPANFEDVDALLANCRRRMEASS